MSEIITLNSESLPIQHLLRKDKRLAKVISMVGDISYEPHSDDPYSFLIHEIIEQMMSIKAGQKIYSRLENLCGGNVAPDTISKLTDEQIRSTGTSNAKVSYIRNVTDAVNTGQLDFNALSAVSDEEVIKTLTSLRGLGTWTAKMYLLFVLNRQDVLPYEDGAFLQSYRWLYKTDDCSPSSIKKKCSKWRPYSSTAARYMYRALDMGLTKKEFHLFKEV